MVSLDSIQTSKASILLLVGEKDSKVVIDLNKKVLNQLKNVKSKELVMMPDAGHLRGGCDRTGCRDNCTMVYR